MFDCGYKTHYMDGQREKFVRLEESPRLSFASDTGRMNGCGLNVEGFNRGPNNPSKSFRGGMLKGSERLKSLGRSLHFGVSKAVFPEDLKVSKKKIFDPQDILLLRMNRLFVISCILAVSVDPLFFYLPVVDKESSCLSIDRKLAVTSTTVRTLIDAFYVIRIYLQFHTAYIAPSSRVFGRGELVIDPAMIARRYLRRFFIIDFLAVLPLPQASAKWRRRRSGHGGEGDWLQKLTASAKKREVAGVGGEGERRRCWRRRRKVAAVLAAKRERRGVAEEENDEELKRRTTATMNGGDEEEEERRRRGGGRRERSQILDLGFGLRGNRENWEWI